MLRPSPRIPFAMLWIPLVAAGCDNGSTPTLPGNAVIGAPTMAEQWRYFGRGFQFSVGFAEAAVPGDIDGDNDTDVFFGGQLFRNVGGGTFESTPIPAPATGGAFADFDGDGDLDLLVGTANGAKLWQNDGSGHFVDVSAGRVPNSFTDTTDVALGDFDRDGDLDALFARGTSATAYWRNDGGTFSDATGLWIPSGLTGARLAVGDFDGDGDLDLVAGCCNKFLRNNGQALVIDPTVTLLPQWPYIDVVAGDVDGDGDLDLAAARAVDGSSAQRRLLQNDGTGHFVDLSSTLPVPPNITGVGTSGVAIGDVDGDGDLDLAFPAQGQLLINQGGNTFVQAPDGAFPLFGCAGRCCFFDVEGDGDLDFATGSMLSLDCLNGGWRPLLLNDGTGTFHHATDFVSSVPPGKAVDIDGDHVRDIVRDGVFSMNDGTGQLTEQSFTSRCTPPPPPSSDGYDTAIADIDGDGDPDLVIPAGPLVYRNDGHGFFTQIVVPAIPNGFCAAVVDTDGDGDMDIVLGRAAFPSTRLPMVMLENLGNENFTIADAHRLPTTELLVRRIAAGDLDGDGDQDLVLATVVPVWAADPLLVFVNDGSGSFTDETATRLLGAVAGAKASYHGNLTLVDLDGEGDLDLLYASAPGNSWFENIDGTLVNRSTAMPFGAGTDPLAYLGAIDVDMDGDLDIVRMSGQGTSIHLQDHPQQFRVDFTTPAFYSQPADVDGDGDPDWYVERNVTRHLHPTTFARVGQPMRYTIFERPGWLVGERWSQVFVSLSRALPPTSTPFGWFHLGAADLVALPPVTVPAPLGETTTSLTLPSDPALIGQRLYAQALTVDPSRGEGHMTNFVVEPIGP